jgi:hypothetical protein
MHRAVCYRGTLVPTAAIERVQTSSAAVARLVEVTLAGLRPPR